MTRILRIEASSRQTGSYSRELAKLFTSRWQAHEPKTEVLVRDLVDQPIPHVASLTIQGYYTPASQMTAQLKDATALSDLLISEVRSADVVVIATPMYNFSIPSALKAWIDQLVRIGHTFSYDGQSFTGLLPGKSAYVIISYGAGGYTGNGPFAAADFVQPYLRFLLNFLGITDVTFMFIEQTTGDAATIAANRAKAVGQIERAVAEAVMARATA